MPTVRTTLRIIANTIMTMPALRIDGVVLAGGQSRRMGRDKAYLEWQGETLLDRAIAVLRASGVDQVQVSGLRPGHGGQPDRVPGQGPLGGLFSLEPRRGADGWLVIPLDMPCLTPALLQHLLEAADSSRARHYAGYTLPCFLPLHHPEWPGLRRRWQAGQWSGSRSLRSLQTLLDAEACPLTPAGEQQLVNVNTPAQWQALQQALNPEAEHETAS